MLTDLDLITRKTLTTLCCQAIGKHWSEFDTESMMMTVYDTSDDSDDSNDSDYYDDIDRDSRHDEFSY